MKSDLNAELRRVLDYFKIRRAPAGVLLRCVSCGTAAETTFDDRCGACYLADKPKRLN